MIKSCLAVLMVAIAGLVATSRAGELTLHAHNDYEHTHPLWDALTNGFQSVEADVYLVDGKLVVNHLPIFFNRERTLQKLYLKPLRDLAAKNGGHITPDGRPFWLLIEIKSHPEATYPVLRQALLECTNFLTRFEGGKVYTNAVTVVITGERPRALVQAEPVRYCALDGFFSNLKDGSTPDLIPWVSERWGAYFSWQGKGEFPAAERQKLAKMLARVHREKRMLRFWEAPDNEGAWRELSTAGVDIINSDDLEACHRFFSQLKKP